MSISDHFLNSDEEREDLNLLFLKPWISAGVFHHHDTATLNSSDCKAGFLRGDDTILCP